MAEKKDVYAAINAVQAELAKEGIGKGRQNKQQNYAFRGIDDVYNALSPLLAKHGLCILPRVVSRECVERVSKSDTALFYVTVRMEFDFVSAADATTHTVSTFGEAMDSGDKATNKAMSAAYKYACMQAFSIPTEGDNDADATTHIVVPARFPTPIETAVAADMTSEANQQKANDIAMILTDLHLAHTQNDDQAEYRAYEIVETLDNELKLAVWLALKDYSKVRSWLKKVAEERRAAA